MKRLFGSYTWKDIITDLVYCVVGSALVGLSLSMFTIPNDIAPGGVSGLSTALAYITPIRVSIWNLMLNVPLLLCAWKLLGPRSLAMTLIATLLLSAFIDLTALLPVYTSNALLASIFGGALSGLGVGLLFLRGISTGGTDLLALMMKKPFPNLPSGTMLLVIDACVVVFAVLIFRDIDVALYSAIAILVSSKVIDALAEGVDYAKVIYTVTDRGDEVTNVLNTYTDRGRRRLYARREAGRPDCHAAQCARADAEAHPSGRSQSLHLCHGLHRSPRRGFQIGLIASPLIPKFPIHDIPPAPISGAGGIAVFYIISSGRLRGC